MLIRRAVDPTQGAIQWGFDIEHDRTVMVNTKLELEPLDSIFDKDDSKYDELDLTLHVARGLGFLDLERMHEEGPSPAYSPKEPGDIVKDYLCQVHATVHDEIKEFDLKHTNTPMDLVLTVPVVRSTWLRTCDY